MLQNAVTRTYFSSLLAQHLSKRVIARPFAGDRFGCSRLRASQTEYVPVPSQISAVTFTRLPMLIQSVHNSPKRGIVVDGRRNLSLLADRSSTSNLKLAKAPEDPRPPKASFSIWMFMAFVVSFVAARKWMRFRRAQTNSIFDKIESLDAQSLERLQHEIALSAMDDVLRLITEKENIRLLESLGRMVTCKLIRLSGDDMSAKLEFEKSLHVRGGDFIQLERAVIVLKGEVKDGDDDLVGEFKLIATVRTYPMESERVVVVADLDERKKAKPHAVGEDERRRKEWMEMMKQYEKGPGKDNPGGWGSKDKKQDEKENGNQSKVYSDPSNSSNPSGPVSTLHEIQMALKGQMGNNPPESGETMVEGEEPEVMVIEKGLDLGDGLEMHVIAESLSLTLGNERAELVLKEHDAYILRFCAGRFDASNHNVSELKPPEENDHSALSTTRNEIEWEQSMHSLEINLETPPRSVMETIWGDLTSWW